MTNDQLACLAFLLEVADRLSRYLASTSQRIFTKPVNKHWAERLSSNPDFSERPDAFVARFSCLQDTLADKLVPEIMRQPLGTPVGAIDNLNRMEKLGLGPVRGRLAGGPKPPQSVVP